jgi:hypothetical protein
MFVIVGGCSLERELPGASGRVRKESWRVPGMLPGRVRFELGFEYFWAPCGFAETEWLMSCVPLYSVLMPGSLSVSETYQGQ